MGELEQPALGDIVIYRNSDGVDMPAIITQLLGESGDVQLAVFCPPGEAKDAVDYQWGAARAKGPDNAGRKTWRPR
jgi:hypothetical protein